jgi:hypothetical protein
MSVLSIDLDESTVATLTALGLLENELSQAVHDAVWFTYGSNPDVQIDLDIAAEFDESRIGVTGEEALAWLESVGTSKALPIPKPRSISRSSF